MKKLTVTTSSKTYDILIGRNTISRLCGAVKPIASSKHVFVITDSTVYPLHFDRVYSILTQGGYQVSHSVIPAGEEYKNMQTVLDIYEDMSNAKLKRSDLVIALGGGVVGDIAGFCAATYMRGIPFIQIPTTLLAQVDSSIGGKTGVDLNAGKNLVGAFWQPSLVVIDIDTLKTLPAIQIKSGMAEIIKSAFIADAELIATLERSEQFEDDAEALITGALNVKRKIVQIDEFEKKERMFLNFGHTLAHSIEKYHHFTGVTHGQAVAIGMYCMQKAYEMAFHTQDVSGQIKRLLEKYGLAYRLNGENLDTILDNTRQDKKSTDSGIHIIVIEQAGKGAIRTMDYNAIFAMIKGAEDELVM